jgi:hypothetical protein
MQREIALKPNLFLRDIGGETYDPAQRIERADHGTGQQSRWDRVAALPRPRVAVHLEFVAPMLKRRTASAARARD